MLENFTTDNTFLLMSENSTPQLSLLEGFMHKFIRLKNQN